MSSRAGGASFFFIFCGIFLVLPHKSFEKICYPEVGCFNIVDWYMKGALPPQHPSLVSTFMYFYNRENPNGTIYKTYPWIQTDGISYDPSKNTIMVCHGFIDHSEDPIVLRLKDSLLRRFDVNLFIIDYSPGASGIYYQTLGNLPVVARLYAKIVLKLGILPSQMHIIGHSLGAHLAGQIGKKIEESTGEKVSRITGLDPAGPWIAQASSRLILGPNDAKFVDVIHSNSLVFGTKKQLGHIDFYINGGAVQPGCFAEKILTHLDFKTFCAHQRGWEYFIDTLDNINCMKGKPVNPANYLAANINAVTVGVFAEELSRVQGTCADNLCAYVGIESIESPLRGKFEVITKNKMPFCIPLL